MRVAARYRRTADGYWEARGLDGWVRLSAHQCDALGLLRAQRAGSCAVNE